MDEVLLWTKNICIAAVGSALLGFILPKGNLQKTGRAVLGFFMIWMVFLPFASFFAEDAPAAFAYEEPADEEISLPEGALAVYEAEIENTVASLLDENGFLYSDIHAVCHTGDDGVIDISRVEITCEKDGEAISQFLREKTGLVVQIISE